MPCCEVLARHPHIAAVTDDVMKLALMNAHQRNRDILSLICSMGLPLLEGRYVNCASIYSLLSYSTDGVGTLNIFSIS